VAPFSDDVSLHSGSADLILGTTVTPAAAR